MDSPKTIASRFYTEVVNKGDSVAMLSIMASDFIDHYAPPTQPRGIDGFRQFLQMVATAFPDIHIEVEDLIAEGNRVVARLKATGTQTGQLMGTIPPSGKAATWSGIDILQIENGKITERWSVRDLLGMMKQIGVVK